MGRTIMQGFRAIALHHLPTLCRPLHGLPSCTTASTGVGADGHKGRALHVGNIRPAGKLPNGSGSF
ncbi:MAG: hypothetical protein SPL48_09850 [Bacteroidales bacterium]|nr:hypothetical protein [Bacteroidales bacterium]